MKARLLALWCRVFGHDDRYHEPWVSVQCLVCDRIKRCD